ncbi:RNA polymerase sigma-70 factor [Brevibacillus sp. SYP-B805]|uniref:RNA polymerase sigma-70 factor n=1 Tax=Brevibacillus sp. SYP-B805 TaxID=1578199 RepID=UPI0019D1F4F3|nr:RNA polymerase sigma-70 factor [Brevibacillus sp. SYP-B805]
MYTTYKPLLFGLAYRMLGSVMDAEDMVQDVFVAIDRLDVTTITNPKAFLCKMVTNRCLDYLRSARKQREVYVGPWLPEPLLADESNDPASAVIARDTLSIAYLTMMEKLTATERAVLVLREALAFDYGEIAEIVGKTEANCRKILSRVKQKLGEEMGSANLPYEQNKKLIVDFMQAIHAGDTEKMLALLAEDVVLYSDGGGKVLAARHPIRSRERVAAFLAGIARKRPAGFHAYLATVNGLPGIVHAWDGRIHSVISYKLRDGRLEAIYIILNPEKLKHISLPASPPIG